MAGAAIEGYKALAPIHHNGNKIAVGEPLQSADFDEQHINELLSVGAIEAAIFVQDEPESEVVGENPEGAELTDLPEQADISGNDDADIKKKSASAKKSAKKIME